MKVLVKCRSMSTSKGMVRNGDIVDLSGDEISKILVTKPNALEIITELPLEKPKRASRRSVKVAKYID